MKTIHKVLLTLIILIIVGVGGFIVVQTWWGIPGFTGKVVTQTLTPQEFSELSVSGSFGVTLAQGETNEVRITTDEGIFPCIQVEEKGNQISLSHQ